MLRPGLAGLVALMLITGSVCAQQALPLPKPPPPLPDCGPAALLYVRFPGPPGVRVTVYPDAVKGVEYPTPVTIGFRPGYIYRLKFTNYPGWPGVSFFPTLEVHGSLKLGSPLRAASYPAPFVVHEGDIPRVLDGAVLTKLLYLEDPDRAFAQQGDKDRPVEITLPPERDLMQEARAMGRPMLVWRLGNKDVEDEELRRKAIPNTVLVPGQQTLLPASFPPFLPLISAKYVDPLLGPKPLHEECLRDGGDRGQPIGLDRNGQLYGLDPEDTVAEYRDGEGRRKIAVSNPVCLCVPRYGVLRTEHGLALTQVNVRVVDNQMVVAHARLNGLTPPLEANQAVTPVGTVGRSRPTETHNQQGTSVVGKIVGPQALENGMKTIDVSAVCREEPRLLDKPLVLTKWTDCKETQIGDLATFYIRYSNQGGRPINDVIVSDSLTGRLEYVPGSAESSRPSVFTAQPNEAGSMILRWEVKGQLKPGESGTVRFQARVR